MSSLLVSYTSLGLQAADEIANASIAAVNTLSKFKPMCFTVLDGTGGILVQKRMDGCPDGAYRQFSYAKARTCIHLQTSSRTFRTKYTMGSDGEAAAAAPPPKFTQASSMVTVMKGDLLPVAGGVLIQTSDGMTIGAVGVSGAAADEDEYLALAGVDAIRATAGGGGGGALSTIPDQHCCTTLKESNPVVKMSSLLVSSSSAAAAAAAKAEPRSTGLNLQAADTIANASIAAVKQLSKFKPMCVTVLDGTGGVLVQKRMDGCPDGAFRQFSYAKARTCVHLQTSSRSFRTKYTCGGGGKENDNDVAPPAKFTQAACMVTVMHGDLLPVAGGILLQTADGSTTVGAVGVSGAAADEDEYLALAGAGAVESGWKTIPEHHCCTTLKSTTN